MTMSALVSLASAGLAVGDSVVGPAADARVLSSPTTRTATMGRERQPRHRQKDELQKDRGIMKPFHARRLIVD
jgi:hypothetical protein